MDALGNGLVNDTNGTVSETEAEIISYEFYQTFRFYLYNSFMPTMSTIGLVGNILAAIVMIKTARQFKMSIYVYMSALTISDAGYLVEMLIVSMFHIWENVDPQTARQIQAYSQSSIIYFDLMLNTVSVFLIIIISIDRYKAISEPLKAHTTYVAMYPIRIILALIAYAVVLPLPLPFCLGVHEFQDERNETVYLTIPKPGMDTFMGVFVMIDTVLGKFAPFFLLIPFNIAIAMKFKKIQAKRKEELRVTCGNVHSRPTRALVTVMVIIVMYLLLTTPKLVVQLLSMASTRFTISGSQGNLFWLLQEVGNCFVVVNASLDFVVYILTSKLYKKRFLETFCGK